MSDLTLTPTTTRRLPRATAIQIAIGTGLLAAGALAATLVLHVRPASDTAKAEASAQALAAGAGTVQPAPTTRATKPGTGGAPSHQAAPDRAVALDTQPALDRPAPVCADCGTVEAVTPVTRKGEGTGVGAVAGGVLGAVVGNQMGSGNGRKAMTVLGAVGGGVAGHEIEKRQRATTVYKVTVRMDDGSRRSFTRNESWAVGRRVTVDGESLRAMRNAPAGEPPVRSVRTSAPA